MNGPSHARARSGIALIMAMVILAALMLLGLPFLFSQTAALSGARSFRQATQAELAVDTAARLGIAITTTATQDSTAASLTNAGASVLIEDNTRFPLAWSGLIADDLTTVWENLQNAGGKTLIDSAKQASPFQPIAPGQVQVDLAGFSDAPFPRTSTARGQRTADANLRVTSLILTDESGKLDPNSLSPAAWDRLLKAVGIADWDDNETVHSRVKLTGVNPTLYKEYDDADSIGELARALAVVRLSLPGQRITDLDQLQQAHTGYDDKIAGRPLTAPEGHATGANPGRHKYETISSPDPGFGLRRRLTRAELDRLRPYLSLHHPRQGRALRLGDDTSGSTTATSGMTIGSAALIDVGSVVAYSSSGNTKNNNTSTSNGVVVYDMADTALGSGSHLWLQTGTNTPRLTIADLVIDSSGLSLRSADNSVTASANDAVYLEAPTAVNVNAAGPVVQAALDLLTPGATGTAITAPVITVGTSSASASVPPLGTLTTYAPTNTTTPPFPLSNTKGVNTEGVNAWELLSPLAFSLTGASTVYAEFPPLTLLGNGIVRIDATCTITGPDGHGTVRRQRSVLAQTLPQDRPVERRWTTQGQMQALIAQRWGSNVTTWPMPLNRVARDKTDATTFPDDPDDGSAVITGTSIRAAVKIGPDVTATPIRPRNWSVNYGIAASTTRSTAAVDSTGTHAKSAIGTDFVATPGTTMLPDGLRVSSTAPFATPVPTGTACALPVNGTDLVSRRLSFWIASPDASLTSGYVPLIEAHNATASLIGQRSTGQVDSNGTPLTEPGSRAQQNRLALWYDAGAKLLVLLVAPPTIEHNVDLGPWITADDPSTPDLNETCLGFGYGNSQDTANYSGLGSGWKYRRLAPASSPTNNGGSVLQRLSGLIRANHIVHLWSVSSGSEFFRQGVWHRIDVLLPNSRAGGLGLLVDGIAGRNALMSNQATSGIIERFGDHATLPGLPLVRSTTATNDTAISAKTVSASATSFEADLRTTDTITVKGLTVNGTTLTAADLYPTAGSIRIDDEWFDYTEISGNDFKNCVRGRRQYTTLTADTPSTLSTDSCPVMPAHDAGALVLPAGLRVTVGANQLYRGGAILGADFASGDPDLTDQSTTYRIWFPLPTRVSDPSISPDLNDPDKFYWTYTPGCNLPADPVYNGGTNITTLLNMFPANGGMVHVGGSSVSYYYHSRDNSGLHGVYQLGRTSSQAISTYSFSSSSASISYYKTGSRSQRGIFLISISTDDHVDPSQNQRYDIRRDPNFTYTKLLQMVDPASGRIEWIEYDRIGLLTDSQNVQRYFFVTDTQTGWCIEEDSTTNTQNGITTANLSGNRGMCRTEFVGRTSLFSSTPLHNHVQPAGIFPAGTPLIPVQTSVSSTYGLPVGHLLAAGDVTTLVRSDSAQNDQDRPFQAVVRYVNTDAYELQKAANFWLMEPNLFSNNWFAFDRALPDTLFANSPGSFTLLAGTGWNPQKDLSTASQASVNGESSMPRPDLWASTSSGSNSATPGLLWWGSNGDNTSEFPTATSATLALDGINAGNLGTATIPTLTSINGDPNETLSDTDTLPVTVTASGPVFDNATTGLVRIGGEVFAYRKNGTDVSLIGRALLGSEKHTHVTGESVQFLPIGPVAVLAGEDGKTGTLTDEKDAWFRLDVSGKSAPNEVIASANGNEPKEVWGDEFAAPYALVCTPDGSNSEVIGLFGPIYNRMPYTTNVGAPSHYGIEYITAAWTRGLFNSPVHDWSSNPNNASATMLRPIAIGWWPRHAPALPRSSADAWTRLSDTNKQAALRSRTYGWVGFPAGQIDARFDPALFAALPSPWNVPVATMSVLDTGANDLLTLDVRALAGGSDWNGLNEWNVPLTTATDLSMNTAFTHSQFANAQAVGGAELRVWWRYAQAPSGSAYQAEILRSVAEAGNTSPAIGPVRLRCLAPTRVLATAEGR
jgi:hypothetical protein